MSLFACLPTELSTPNTCLKHQAQKNIRNMDCLPVPTFKYLQLLCAVCIKHIIITITFTLTIPFVRQIYTYFTKGTITSTYGHELVFNKCRQYNHACFNGNVCVRLHVCVRAHVYVQVRDKTTNTCSDTLDISTVWQFNLQLMLQR